MWIQFAALLALATPTVPAPSLAPGLAPAALEETSPEVQQAVEGLEASVKAKEVEARLGALREFGRVQDEKVCEAIGHYLKDRETKVVVAALEALRHNTREGAVDVLESYYKKNKKAVHDETAIQAPFMKALGWHAAESSIDILTDKPFSKGTSNESVRARILGLGKIRTAEALDGLVSMTHKVSRQQLDNYVGDVRISLYLLTGTDQGNSPDLWRKWWNETKKDFEVPSETPKLSASQQFVWNEFWGLGANEEDEDE